jgi:hypothetical protein
MARPLAELVQDYDAADGELESALRLSMEAPAAEPMFHKAHDQMLRASCCYFFQEMIRGPQEKPYRGKSLVGRHHIEWDTLLTEKLDADKEDRKILVEAARDHGKSHFFSLALPLWNAWYRYPGKLGYIFSATQTLADELFGKLQTELLENEKLAYMLPTTRDRDWSKSKITLRNGSVILSRGVGVKVRGGHPHWIVVDDGLSDEDIYSETIRRRNIDYFLSAIVNMLVPGGTLVVVGTPMHFADLYAYLANTGEYVCRYYPAIDRRERILFPERYNKKRLAARKRELGPARFAREFLCQPLTDDASMFPSRLFEGDVRMPYKLGMPAEWWEERGYQRFTGVDFAMSSSAQADYTVIFTIAVDEHGNRWLANIRRGKGWGFQRQLDEIKDENTLMRPDVIQAEANQMQRIFSDELIRTTDLPIRKFYTSGVQPKQPWRKGMAALTLGKHSLDRGVPSLSIGLENRKWRFPRGDRHAIEMTDIWMGELQAMSWQDGKLVSAGEHDDCVMAMWMADSAAKYGGFKFSFGDDDDLADGEDFDFLDDDDDEEDDDLMPQLGRPREKVAMATKSPVDSRPSWMPREGAPVPSDLGFDDDDY